MARPLLLAVPALVGLAAGALLAAQPDPGERVLTASALASGGSPALGDEGAPITILEWGDYQCTYCFKFHQSTLEALEAEYIDTGRARLVFKDFPLNGPDSVMAAEATHCAAEQGMYWEYHGALYDGWGGERTGWITRASLAGIAADVGLEPGAFGACMDSQRHRGTVLGLYEAGRGLGISGTPSFLVFDGEDVVKITGSQPLRVFVRALDGLGAQN